MARQTQIQVRRDTAANWTSTNPTLASGEIGFETDTLKAKIGNGTTAWTSLAYQNYLAPTIGSTSIASGSTNTTIAGLTLTAPVITLATNAQTASYTTVLADAGKMIEMNVASANNLTVPLNSSVAYAVGTEINILQTGAGQTTVVATGGVTINGTPGLKLRAQWSAATLIKRATDTWVLIGDLSA